LREIRLSSLRVFSIQMKQPTAAFCDNFLRGHEVSYYGDPELLEALPPCGYQLEVAKADTRGCLARDRARCPPITFRDHRRGIRGRNLKTGAEVSADAYQHFRAHGSSIVGRIAAHADFFRSICVFMNGATR